MTDADNVALVQAIYADFAKGDIPSMLGKLAPDVEFISPGSLPWAGTHVGYEAVGAFFQQLGGALDITRFEPSEFVASGDKVLALGSEAAAGRASGRGFEMRFAHVWTVRDGVVVRWEDFYDTGTVAAVL